MGVRKNSEAHGLAGQLSRKLTDGVKCPRPCSVSDNMRKDACGMFQDSCVGPLVSALLCAHPNEASGACMQAAAGYMCLHLSHWLHHMYKIGRASCRERVSPYV